MKKGDTNKDGRGNKSVNCCMVTSICKYFVGKAEDDPQRLSISPLIIR